MTRTQIVMIKFSTSAIQEDSKYLLLSSCLRVNDLFFYLFLSRLHRYNSNK